uniref:phosphatidate phosphatase n=1 Tax=Trichuris muris TaxID=70415 RepID=A0A5S6QWX6_TRIMR
MQSFSRMLSSFREFYNEINPATLSGAVDVLVIEQPNGSYIGSPFHVRFGKMGVLRSREKIVYINDQLVNILMQLSDTGEAFFLDRLTEPVNSGDDPISSSESECESSSSGGRQFNQEHVASTSANVTEHSGEPFSSNNKRSRLSSGDHMPLGNLSPQCRSASEGCIPTKLAAHHAEDRPTGLNISHSLGHSFNADWHSKESYSAQEPNGQGNSDRPSSSAARDLSQGHVEAVAKEVEEEASVGKEPSDADNLKGAEHLSDKERPVKIDERSSGWKLWPLGNLIRSAGKQRPQEDSVYLQDLETMSPTAVNRYLPKTRADIALPEQSEHAGPVDATAEGESAANDADSIVGGMLTDLVESTAQDVDSLRPSSRRSGDDAGYGSRAASDGGYDEVRQELRLGESVQVDLSLCGNCVVDEQYEKLSADDFDDRKVTLEQLSKDPSVLSDPQLVVRLNGKYYAGKFGLAKLVASVAFGQPLCPIGEVKRSSVEQEEARTIVAEDGVANSGGVSSWFSWRRRTASTRAKQEKAPGMGRAQTETNGEGSSKLAYQFDASIAAYSRLDEHDMRSALSDSELEDRCSFRDPRRKGSQMRNHKRCVVLSSEQLKSLPLARGINKARFSVTTKYQGTCWCECHIFLWRWDDKLVISDIDGTITKSDVLGHILPMVGAQWIQSGVTEFFSRVVDNGYRIIYLSARAIGQSQSTKDYLRWIKQGKLGLPIGPIFLSPTSLIIALHREIIEKTPEIFKTDCLMGIRGLFPPTVNPFYAGVGNRHNDVVAYTAVDVPPQRIFLINHYGEVQSLVKLSILSYHRLSDLVDHVFPPLSRREPENVLESDFFEPGRFSSFNYWKPRLPDISEEEKLNYMSR